MRLSIKKKNAGVVKIILSKGFALREMKGFLSEAVQSEISPMKGGLLQLFFPECSNVLFAHYMGC